ncbi:MAG: hypothetical protein JXB23_17990, partial [Candidatus Aminicenantes bacterium]|nr:hypothetical protein [Candidatus Aminicenantes bacterium]
MHVLGRDIFLLHPNGEISIYSFEKNERIRIGATDSPALVLKSLSRDKIISGHIDGKIRIWDFASKTIRILGGHSQPVISLTADYQGRIYSGGLDRSLKQWDFDRNRVNVAEETGETAYHLRLYPRGKILAASSKDLKGCASAAQTNLIRILDFEDGRCRTIPSPSERAFTSINVYFDGRIIATLAATQKEAEKERDLVIISPGEDRTEFHILAGHSKETKDSLVMGPKIITCGSEDSLHHSLRVWGTEFFVRMESGKLTLQG